MRMSGLKLRKSVFFYTLAIGTFLVLLPSWARAQENTSGSSLNKSRQFAAIAHNPAAHQFVLFGGINSGLDGGGGGPYFNDTWIWRGTRWEEQSPTLRPEPRFETAMAYDSARREVVLFGGVDQHSPRTVSTPWATVRVYPDASSQLGTEAFYRDTWIWDGRDWTQRSPGLMPPERACHAMAFDAARKQVVLFGGLDRQGKLLNDTWVWDGSNWRKMNPANIPPARHWHAMAYDSHRQQVVMFGGLSGKDALGDTWIWDGNNWDKAEPSGDVPEARFEAGMDYDPYQKRLVLISGYVQDPTGKGTTANDSWTWDGDHWTKLALGDEFELVHDYSRFDPKDANRALIVNVASPLIWVRGHARRRTPRGENSGDAAKGTPR